MIFKPNYGFLLLIIFLFGCSYGRVKTIWVQDIEMICPQPEADILGKRITDSIIKQLLEKKLANTVTNKEINSPDFIIKGKFLGYQPSSGVQFVQGRDVLFSASIDILERSPSGSYVSNIIDWHKENKILPSEGCLLVSSQAMGVCLFKMCLFPSDALSGFPSEEEKVAREAVNKVTKLIKKRTER